MDFVIISTADWDNPFWTNKQHVAKTLVSLGHRVLYVESLGLRRPSITKSDGYRILKRLQKVSKGIRQVEENIWVVSPFSVPLQRIKFIRSFNIQLLIWLIKTAVRRLGFSKIILWTYSPISGSLVGKLEEHGSVYHCVDEIKAQPGMPVKEIEQCETELLKKVDLIFTTSRELQSTRSAIKKECYYFSNVADFNHFNLTMSMSYNRPEEFERLQSPIIGFVGAISGYKLDFKLIEFIATNKPDYQFVFIGKVGEGDPWTDINNLTVLPNVHFLGPKAYSELPRYLQYIDICILPCSINEYTANMFPMKFFEYLAAGKPVISTNLPALKEYSHLCRLCNTYENFSSVLEEVYNNVNQDAICKGLEEAREHTYEKRTNTMLHILNKHLMAEVEDKR